MSTQNGVQIPETKTGSCTGKKFLVTGGTRGLGKAIVTELNQQGSTVYVLARNPDNLKALKKQFPNVKTICVDLSNWDETENALKDLEPLDCLINNAAIAIPAGFMETTKDILDRVYNTNLRSVLNISQIVSKKMIEKGNGGSIVNISSTAGRTAQPGILSYCIMKAALEMLTKTMAIELGPHKITVNSVCPSIMETDMIFGDNDANRASFNADAFCQYIQSKTPTKTRFIPMSEVVSAILFFGANTCPQITGESLLVDGGVSIVF